MHQSVLDHFVDFTKPLEGQVNWMYLDVLGLVTVGIGNLIDPVSAALELRWKMPDGSLASKDIVAAQWHDLKAQQRLAKLHYKFAAPVTTVRLTDADVADLVRARLLANEVLLKKAFPTWDQWPADAQLAACSMAWAVGAGFPHIFGNFTKFANLHDWMNAAACCAIKTDGNPGIVPRNAANKLCLANAALAQASDSLKDGKLSLEVLYWPNAAHEDVQPVASEAKAELDLHEARLAIALGTYAFSSMTGHEGSDGINEEFREQQGDTEPSPPPDEKGDA